MPLTRDEMLRALMTSDAAYNGRFVTGVLSTGIYCLPSCHARKPKPENVRFYDTFGDARAAGLRACRKCRPDAFERGESDHEMEALEETVAKLRARPEAFPDVASLGRSLGVGETKLFALVRRHYHATPAALLSEARIDRAQSLLRAGDATVAEIAFAVGFETLSAFYAHFQARTGMNPSGYRRVGEGAPFVLALPCPYRSSAVLAHLGRDAESVTERVVGAVAEVSYWSGGEPATLRFEFAGDEVRVDSDGEPYDAHRVAVRMLGFAQDAAGFEAHARRGGFDGLVAGHEGLRVPQTPSLFDALVWSVVGQQVGLGFAYALRRRLAARLSTAMPNGLHPPPTPARVREMDPADFVPMQFSRSKADYVLGIAREVPPVEGVSATRAAATLLEVRGLGPWAANYVMMRGLGFGDCVPLGDTGLLAGLRKLHGRAVEAKEVANLMTVFAPYRSLATFHLWHSLKEQP